MKLSDLFFECETEGSEDPKEIEITGVCDHTDDLEEGMLFIAFAGAHTDPLSRLDEIEAKKAAAILLSSEAHRPRKTAIPCFFTKKPEEVLSKIWSRYFKGAERNLRIFGVTGTNGKTSTALILTHLLNVGGIPTAYIGTLGTEFGGKRLFDREDGMTTPSAHRLHERLSALSRMGALAVVLEASSHAIHQKRTAALRFEAAIFTNLTEDHLDYHKTMENYFSCKKALFDQADFAVVNLDDDYGARLFNELSCQKASVAVIENADYTATDLHENGLEGTEYQCCTPFGTFAVSYPLFGAFNVYNTLSAIALAVHAGLCPAEIQKGLFTLSKPKGRLEKLPLDEEYSVIIDYAHTPDAMKEAIKAVRRVTQGRLFVLFGAGGDREREKRSEMGRIACALADRVFITEDNPREEAQDGIFRDILQSAKEFSNYTVIKDRKTAIITAQDGLQRGDTLLLLGKGHEEYMIYGREKIPFSEKDIIIGHAREKKKT